MCGKASRLGPWVGPPPRTKTLHPVKPNYCKALARGSVPVIWLLVAIVVRKRAVYILFLQRICLYYDRLRKGRDKFDETEGKWNWHWWRNLSRTGEKKKRKKHGNFYKIGISYWSQVRPKTGMSIRNSVGLKSTEFSYQHFLEIFE